MLQKARDPGLVRRDPGNAIYHCAAENDLDCLARKLGTWGAGADQRDKHSAEREVYRENYARRTSRPSRGIGVVPRRATPVEIAFLGSLLKYDSGLELLAESDLGGLKHHEGKLFPDAFFLPLDAPLPFLRGNSALHRNGGIP
jgi:hypothetical protein